MVGRGTHRRQSGKGATPVMGISGTPWEYNAADFDVILEKPFSIGNRVDYLAVLGTRSKHRTRKYYVV